MKFYWCKIVQLSPAGTKTTKQYKLLRQKKGGKINGRQWNGTHYIIFNRKQIKSKKIFFLLYLIFVT